MCTLQNYMWIKHYHVYETRTSSVLFWLKFMFIRGHLHTSGTEMQIKSSHGIYNEAGKSLWKYVSKNISLHLKRLKNGSSWKATLQTCLLEGVQNILSTMFTFAIVAAQYWTRKVVLRAGFLFSCASMSVMSIINYPSVHSLLWSVNKEWSAYHFDLWTFFLIPVISSIEASMASLFKK